ncbi:hypothetical protein BsWGS_08391 [Bradybaena similaris]
MSVPGRYYHVYTRVFIHGQRAHGSKHNRVLIQSRSRFFDSNCAQERGYLTGWLPPCLNLELIWRPFLLERL